MGMTQHATKTRNFIVPSLMAIRREIEKRANLRALIERLPPKIKLLFPKDKPRGSVLYRAARGGRGSGKSQSLAQVAAAWGAVETLRILCTREYQASIKESFHAELKAAIASDPWLEAQYDVGTDYIRGIYTGTEFIFRGLRHSVNTIKSLAKIDLTIVEEAEDVPEVAWLALEATVFRQPKSELWAIWNPRLDGSPVDNRFVKSPPENALSVEVNWQDNIYFPANMEILRQREQKRLDPATYAHVWEGAYLVNSLAQVFNGKYREAEFNPDSRWDGPYYGGDFGFSQDPSAAVEIYIHDDCLWISREVGGVGIELDDLPGIVLERIPNFAAEISRWDSSRPESISHIQKHGIPKAEAVEKWKGSVEDGVMFMRSFREIVVHSRCRNTLREMLLYSFKVDRLTQDIRSEIVDANNHYIDATRYALAPMIKAGDSAMVFL